MAAWTVPSAVTRLYSRADSLHFYLKKSHNSIYLQNYNNKKNYSRICCLSESATLGKKKGDLRQMSHSQHSTPTYWTQTRTV